MLSESQLRAQIGDAAFDAIPNADQTAQNGEGGTKCQAPRSGKARCRNRAAAWHKAVTRAAAYKRDLAKSPEEAAALDAELQETLAEGPDFTKYHRGSKFMEPPQVCTDRNFLTRVWFVALTLERKTWATREKGKHGGALGRSALELLRTLLFVVSKGEGRVYPSLDQLARLARMSRQTVVSAIERLKSLGFITVHRRIKRIHTSLGLRVVQDSNAYVYDLPTGLGALGWATVCQSESNNFTARETPERRKMLTNGKSGRVWGGLGHSYPNGRCGEGGCS